MKWGMNGLGLLMVLTLISVARAEPSGLLNDTGQTQCLNVTGTALEQCNWMNTGIYSPLPRQDGQFGRDPAAIDTYSSDLQKPEGSGGRGGFAFTPLDGDGKPISLAGNPPAPSSSPRCIWDRVTNLIWEIKTDDSGPQDKDWGYVLGGTLGGDTCGGTLSNCNTDRYVSEMNSKNPEVCHIEGSGNWRLPTRRELLSIVDFDLKSPSIDLNYFTNTPPSSGYWSSNLVTNSPGYAWTVAFTDGDSSSNPYLSSNSANLRLVKDGPVGTPTQPDYIDNADGSVTDTRTGLIWDKCSWGQSGSACASGSAEILGNRSQALQVAVTANNLKWRGHSDWRLPNVKEMESLVRMQEYLPTEPAIDDVFFPNTPREDYWTSTAYTPDPAYSWHVAFTSGYVASAPLVPLHNPHVRLVRGGMSFDDFYIIDKNMLRAHIIIPFWNKAYDGTDEATVDGCIPIDGLVPGDDVSCTASAKIGPNVVDPRHGGAPQTVTAGNVTLTGTDAHKYFLWDTELSNKEAIVFQRYVTAVLDEYTMVYNGNTYLCGNAYCPYVPIWPVGTETPQSITCHVEGTVNNETMGCIVDSGYFISSDVGNDIPIHASLFPGYNEEGNYYYSTSISGWGNIAPRPTLPHYIEIKDKIYDGLNVATVGDCLLANYIGYDEIFCSAIKAEFTEPTAGNNKMVSVDGLKIEGKSAKNYYLASSTATTWGNILKAPATVTLGNLTKTYTGSPLSPSATTNPASLAFTWTGAPQTNAGSYPVTATVNEQNYEGSASGTFVIQRAAATVSLGNLTQTYTGLPLSPTATTNPPGLSVSLTGAPQTNAGSYPVSASITDGNYTGTASGTLTIAKAPQAPVFINAPAWVRYQQAGLTVFGFGGSGGGTFTYSAAGSTACAVHPTSGALTITSGSGSCQVTATRLADNNYQEASSAPAIIQVNKALQAPLNVSADPPSFFSGGPGTTLGYAGGTINGSVAYQVSGSPASLTCKISGSTLTATGGAGTCFVTATMAGNANYEPVTSAVLDVPVIGGVLTGLAAQGQVGTNNQVQFGAFTISGESRKVLIRGLGPALDGFVSNAIRDPKIALSLNGELMPLEVNDDWADADNAAEIMALKHQPKNPTESAILRTLEPGIYNVHLSGSDGTEGIGMFQVYAVEGGGNGELKGLAAQGQVGTGNQVQFGAFTISGGPRKVLIRGLGPALDPYILGAIRDPKIALSLNGAPMPLEVNDDWADADNAEEIMALKHQPKNPTESAILRTLEPGVYNVHLSGSGGTEGIGMFQVYTVE